MDVLLQGHPPNPVLYYIWRADVGGGLEFGDIHLTLFSTTLDRRHV